MIAFQHPDLDADLHIKKNVAKSDRRLWLGHNALLQHCRHLLTVYSLESLGCWLSSVLGALGFGWVKVQGYVLT